MAAHHVATSWNRLRVTLNLHWSLPLKLSTGRFSLRSETTSAMCSFVCCLLCPIMEKQSASIRVLVVLVLWEGSNKFILPVATMVAQRGTRYCWAWRKHSFDTNNLTMFLETEALFPCHNESIKMARIIWFGSTSVDIGSAYVNNWQRFGCFGFWVYLKVRNSLKPTTYAFVSIKKKNICQI